MSADVETTTRPAPLTDGDTAPFWAAARDRRLAIQFCSSCQKLRFPPKPNCPECLGTLEWKSVVGTGRVYSYCVSRMNFVGGFKAPYVVAWIAIDEQDDCRLNANILDCPIDEVRIDMPVEVVFEERRDGVIVPQFRPARRVG